MGQSLVKNYIHITFSTKNRNNLIAGGLGVVGAGAAAKKNKKNKNKYKSKNF